MLLKATNNTKTIPNILSSTTIAVLTLKCPQITLIITISPASIGTLTQACLCIHKVLPPRTDPSRPICSMVGPANTTPHNNTRVTLTNQCSNHIYSNLTITTRLIITTSITILSTFTARRRPITTNLINNQINIQINSSDRVKRF